MLVVLREYQYAIFERHQPLAMVEGVVVYHAHYASLFDTGHMIEHMLRSLETLMASSIFVLWWHKCAQSLGACHQLNCHDMILIHHPAVLREHIFGLLFSVPLGCLWFLVYKYVKVCHFPIIHIVQILQLLILIVWGHLVILFVICMLLCLYKTHHLFIKLITHQIRSRFGFMERLSVSSTWLSVFTLLLSVFSLLYSLFCISAVSVLEVA